MKKLWRIVALVLTICTVLPCLAHIPIKVQAATRGTCGDNLTWVIDVNDLVISGTGDMYDYSPESPAPWSDHPRLIMTITIENGVTSIGDYAFAGCQRAIYSHIAPSVSRVGSHVWDGCNGYVAFLGYAPTFAKDAFAGKPTQLVYTLHDWDEAVKQPYGGNISWDDGYLRKTIKSKSTFQLNEQLTAEDFDFMAYFGETGYHNTVYTPWKISFSHYDNSTPGPKSVTVNADGHIFTHDYIVIDSPSEFDNIRVAPPKYMEYNGINQPSILLCDGDKVLQKDKDYVISYKGYNSLTNNAQATITGIGNYEGYERTFTYAIVKRDMTEYYLELENTTYTAEPVIPTSKVCHNSTYAPRLMPRTTVAEQNINVGEGFARSICTGNYYGAPVGNFQIQLGSSSLKMPGYYMGQIDDTLDDQTIVSEAVILPGKFTGYVDTELVNVAYYELYKLEGENLTLVTTYESGVNFSTGTGFSYDFSTVYEDAKDTGFASYILSYVWQDENGGLYSGNMILYILSQVPEASTMQLNVFADDGYFREEYLYVSSEDGALEKTVWEISDSSIATIDRGAVTFLKPGSVTVTATCGKFSAQQTFTIDAIPMEQAVILGWDTLSGIANVVYDHILLKAGIDYTTSTTVSNGVMTITITGQGLFNGVASRRFDLATGEPLGDTTPGLPAIPGDINDDTAVNNDDVALLLWHTLFPEDYPIDTNGDITGDGETNNEDVALLLWHTLFPEDYPL